MSSSYVTWYALGTLFTKKGPFHRGANLLVRSGGVVITKMRSSSRYGLMATGAGDGVICWWVRARRCLTISTYATGSSREGEAQASPSRSGGRAGSLPVAIIDAEKPWGSCTMAFSASMMPGISTTHFREGKSLNKRARSMLFMVLWLRSLMELPSG